MSNNVEEPVVTILNFNLCAIKDKNIKLQPLDLSFYTSPDSLKPAKGLPNYSFKVDLWSIGVILYQLLSGSLPFMARKKAIVKVSANDPNLKIQFETD